MEIMMIKAISSDEHRLTAKPTKKFVRHLKPGDRILLAYDWYRLKVVRRQKETGKIKMVYSPCDPRKYHRRIECEFDPNRLITARLPADFDG